MINKTMISHSSDSDCNCLSWKPIVAGALIAVGLSFLLNLFGVAIGLTAFTTNSEGVESLVLGGLLGTSISIIAAMFAAGWLTGYFARNYCTKRHTGAVYGFLAWTLALIISIFLMSHAQEYVSFYGHFISGTANSTLQVASNNANNSVSTHLSTQQVTISAYIIFILFFLSAFSCSLGGHIGMRYRFEEDSQI